MIIFTCVFNIYFHYLYKSKTEEKIQKKNKVTKWNFKKADWGLYYELCKKQFDQILESDHSSVDEFCDSITKAILEASAKSIPRGCRKLYKPFWTPEIQEAVDRRTTARLALEKSPTEENKSVLRCGLR